MYNAVIPSYDIDADKQADKKNGETINADDPKNKDKVRSILYG